MKWTVEDAGSGLGARAADWDALNDRLHGGHPMLSSHFVASLMQHFPAPDAHLCTGRDAGGTVVAMLLLRPVKHGVWASYLPAQAQVGPALLSPRTELGALLRGLPGTALQLDLMCVDPLYTDDRVRQGRRITAKSHALTITVDLRGDFDAYWAGRPKKLRDNLRRYEKRAQEDHAHMRWAVWETPADMPDAVARYAELEAQGWKGRSGTALSEGGQAAFYTALLTEHAQRGGARVIELWFGDSLVASRLVIAGNGLVLALKTCFSEDYRRYAPGRLMLKRVIELAFSSWPGWRFEFYTNATVDQLAWSTSQRHMIHLTVARNAAVSWLNNARRRVRSIGRQPRAGGAGADGDVVEHLDRFDGLPEDVSHLFAKAEADRISTGTDWLSMLAAYGLPEGTRIGVSLLRRQGVPVAALPWMRRSGSSTVEALSTYYTALYSPAFEPGLDSTALVPLVKAVLRMHPDATALQFGPMDPLGPGYDMLEAALRASGLATFDYFCHGNWHLPVTSSWEDYLADRDGKLRSTVRRMGRKLEAAGGRLEIIGHADDVERGIRAYEHVYSQSWKRPEPHAAFMPNLIRLCARRGWLRLGIAWLGEAPIAAQVWIVANQRAEIYKLAYDEAHKALAPGTVLTAHLMQHAMEVDTVTEVDYLIGDDPYKAQWMTHRRERRGLIAYRWTTFGGAAACLREVLARRIKSMRGQTTQP